MMMMMITDWLVARISISHLLLFDSNWIVNDQPKNALLLIRKYHGIRLFYGCSVYKIAQNLVGVCNE